MLSIKQIKLRIIAKRTSNLFVNIVHQNIQIILQFQLKKNARNCSSHGKVAFSLYFISITKPYRNALPLNSWYLLNV